MSYKPVPLGTALELSVECQINPWICVGGKAFGDDLVLDMSSPFLFIRADSVDELKALFVTQAWPIRSGLVYGELSFVKQSLTEDEWFVLKHFPAGWLGFSILSLVSILTVNEGRFDRLIANMQKAEEEACRSHTFDPEITLMAMLDNVDRPIVETARIHAECEKKPILRDHVTQSLIRFLNRDWGDTPQEDKIANEEHAHYQLARYNFPPDLYIGGEKSIWILNDGSCITLLFPSDY